MVLPALFAAGMSLIDTTDGILMLGACDWALIKPTRKRCYNLTIASVSVVVALLIGGIEALGMLDDQLALKGRLWDAVGAWIGSVIIYRYQGLDDLEVTPAGR